MHQRNDRRRAKTETETECHVDEDAGKREQQRVGSLRAKFSADDGADLIHAEHLVASDIGLEHVKHIFANLVVLRLEAKEHVRVVKGLYRCAALAYLAERGAHIRDIHRFFKFDLQNDASGKIDPEVKPLRQQEAERREDTYKADAYQHLPVLHKREI